MSRPTDPFDELRVRLEQAHAVVPDPTQARRRRPSRRVALLGVAGILATGTAVAATAPWSPTLGGDHGIEPPGRASRPVPAAQVQALAVLRRPQTDADRSAPVLRALRTVGRYLGTGVHVEGIRILRRHRDRTILLVPLQRVGPPGIGRDRELRDALCVYETDVPGAAGPPGTVTTRSGAAVPLPQHVSGAACGTLADLRRRGIGGTTAGLVPDGVARVRLTARDGETLTAPVRDNYYELPVRGRPRGGAGTDAGTERRLRDVSGRPTVWLDARGRPVPKGDR
ncbi:hypothetical protein [Patulibacter sp. SYSU D01012]|uniref:hypothetical protein n=1 Tax=Patulibacter sp. SYSU D01012 TaxID=2817381 RepID=UPI001B30CFA0|nr:hypothetical protein [Patulibacter sp. SYSU D01012]